MSDATGPALVVTRHGGIDVLAVEQRPAPEPGAGEVLVEVAAAGVNFIDVYQREGVYPTTPPFVGGNEGAGTVVAVGEGIEGFRTGDRVAWPQGFGSAASSRRAAGIRPGARARRGRARDGGRGHAPGPDRPLPHHQHVCRAAPATSRSCTRRPAGSGSCSCRLVRARGGIVVATAGGPEKCETARAVGAEHVIDYRAVDDLADEVRRVTDGRGVDVAYDGVGKDTFDASLASLKPRGMLVLFGGASGQVPPFDIQRLNRGGSLFLTRPTLGSLPRHPRGAASGVPARCSARWPTAACRWRSVAATRSPRPRRRTRTSRGGTPRASCSSSPDPTPPTQGVSWRWSRGRRWRR